MKDYPVSTLLFLVAVAPLVGVFTSISSYAKTSSRQSHLLINTQILSGSPGSSLGGAQGYGLTVGRTWATSWIGLDLRMRGEFAQGNHELQDSFGQFVYYGGMGGLGVTIGALRGRNLPVINPFARIEALGGWRFIQSNMDPAIVATNSQGSVYGYEFGGGVDFILSKGRRLRLQGDSRWLRTTYGGSTQFDLGAITFSLGFVFGGT